ncbi:MAG: hypothetical protein JRH13_15600 [Deltaproteobacteria bacterium]|nr:hypothetical protein [Deltaproteobacteria bacterium]MBW2130774.1 hypothetical protein [Deltaproteobacteria bacterium]MBW2302239.1 hypothetical protein [Deltaproteobacteria bacterium]
MATIQPKGEKIRQAVKWISSEKLEDEGKSLLALVEEAASRFNLSPAEEEYLRDFYRKNEETG